MEQTKVIYNLENKSTSDILNELYGKLVKEKKNQIAEDIKRHNELVKKVMNIYHGTSI